MLIMLKKESNLLFYECLKCKKYCSFQFESKVKHKFTNIFKCCNVNLIKFPLFFKKAFCPYKHMDSWSKFDKTSISNRQGCSNLNVEGISGYDYEHGGAKFK